MPTMLSGSARTISLKLVPSPARYCWLLDPCRPTCACVCLPPTTSCCECDGCKIRPPSWLPCASMPIDPCEFGCRLRMRGSLDPCRLCSASNPSDGGVTTWVCSFGACGRAPCDIVCTDSGCLASTSDTARVTYAPTPSSRTARPNCRIWPRSLSRTAGRVC